VTGWEFWRSVLVQALGTILGGAILALAGIAIGAIHGVSLLAVSLVALVFAVIGIAFQVLEEMASEYSEEEIQNKGVWLVYSDEEKAELLEIYARKQEER
jgi:hypothetical protein